MTTTTAPRFVPAVEQLGDRIVPSFVTRQIAPQAGGVMSSDSHFFAFITTAQLDSADTNGVQDVYLKNRFTGAVSLVSRSSGANGTVGNAASVQPALGGLDLSADGRYVVFDSDASNLVPGDTNARSDVFIRDTVLNTTTLVSLGNFGVDYTNVPTKVANNSSFGPRISSNGQVVVFTSAASDLVAGGLGTDDAQVYARNMLTAQTERVSLGNSGNQAFGGSFGQAVNGDGRYVTFISADGNLVPGDTNGMTDVFLRDRIAGTTTRVSLTVSGGQRDRPSGHTGFYGLLVTVGSSISDDGRIIAFTAEEYDVVNRTSGRHFVYVYDGLSKTVRLVGGDPTSGAQIEAGLPSVSGNGRYVAYDGLDGLFPGDENTFYDVFVRDLQTNDLRRVSVGIGGAEPNAGCGGSSISSDGKWVTFSSSASNLVPNDLNAASDLFLTQLPVPSVIVSGAATGGGPTVNIHNPDGTVARTFQAYPAAYTGGVFVAAGDLTGDGVEEVVTSTGVGGSANIRVFDQQNVLLHSFFAYPPQFTGGVNVAVGDVNGDGVADIVCGVGVTGGPNVRILDGRAVAAGNYSLAGVAQGGALLASFFAYPESFTGGVRVAVADVNNDGFADVVCGVGSSGGPNVRILDGRQLSLGNFTLQPTAAGGALVNSFFALPETFTGGVFVGTGDVNNDGTPDVVIGVESGGGPNVRAYDAATTQELGSFFAFDRGLTGGVRVATADVDLDGFDDFVTGTGPGTGSLFRVFSGKDRTSQLAREFAPFGTFSGGVNVG